MWPVPKRFQTHGEWCYPRNDTEISDTENTKVTSLYGFNLQQHMTF